MRNMSKRYVGLRQVNACHKFSDGTAIWGNYCKSTGEYYLAGTSILPDGSMETGLITSGFWTSSSPEEEELFQITGAYSFEEVREVLLTGDLARLVASE